MSLINEIGNRHGRLVVRESAGRDKGGEALWLCDCDCGEVTVVGGYSLRSGHIKSCGCSKKEKTGRKNPLYKGPNVAEHLSSGITVLWLNKKDATQVPCYIDTVDYPLVQNIRWFAWRGRNTWYARSNRPAQYLHRILFPDSVSVDHEDRDGLNCRRENLRPATQSQNSANQTRRHSGSSQYKGVCWDKRAGKWMARITVEYKELFLGYFDSEEPAARAYDTAAQKHFGEFAVLNFAIVEEPDAVRKGYEAIK